MLEDFVHAQFDSLRFGGGGGAPGNYTPIFGPYDAAQLPGYINAPGSGGSGVVYVIYDAVTGETSNGAVYFIN